MKRGDGQTHMSFLKELRRLQAKLPAHSVEDINWARCLAFSHKCRDSDYAKMVNDLIEKITPIAVKERLAA